MCTASFPQSSWPKCCAPNALSQVVLSRALSPRARLPLLDVHVRNWQRQRPACSATLSSFLNLTRRFWNQILTCFSDRLRNVAISMRRSRDRYMLAENSLSSSRSCVLVNAVRILLPLADSSPSLSQQTSVGPGKREEEKTYGFNPFYDNIFDFVVCLFTYTCSIERISFFDTFVICQFSMNYTFLHHGYVVNKLYNN